MPVDALLLVLSDVRVDVIAHNNAVLLALVVLWLLGTWVLQHTCRCRECPHCRDEERKSRERSEEYARRNGIGWRGDDRKDG